MNDLEQIKRSVMANRLVMDLNRNRFFVEALPKIRQACAGFGIVLSDFELEHIAWTAYRIALAHDSSN